MTSIARRTAALSFAAILCAGAPAALAGPPQGSPSSPPSGSGPSQGAPLDKNSVVQCKGASAAAAAANYAISIDGGLLAGGQASGLTGNESLSNTCHYYSGHSLLGGGPIFNVLRSGYNIKFSNGVVGAHANRPLLDPGAANAPFCFRITVFQGSDLAIVVVDGAKPLPC